MSDTFDDLKRLKEMLDAGEVTQDQYEIVKAELIGDVSTESKVSNPQIAPGWYEDPNEPTQQRYWDGEKWTEARQLSTEVTLEMQAAEAEPVPIQKRAWFYPVVGFSLLVILLTLIDSGSDSASSLALTVVGLGMLGLIGYAFYRVSDNDTDVSAINQLPPSVQMAVSQMQPANQKAFFLEYNQKRRKKWVGYFALIFIGWHYLYVGKVGVQFAFWLTLGGFGFWWFVDLFRIPTIIAMANEVIARQALQTLVVGHQFTSGYGGSTPPPPPA